MNYGGDRLDLKKDGLFVTQAQLLLLLLFSPTDAYDARDVNSNRSDDGDARPIRSSDPGSKPSALVSCICKGE